MKLRFFFTFVITIIYIIICNIINLYYSPISGILTAQTLNGDSHNYALAKFVQTGGLNEIITVIFIFIAVLIWWKPIFGKAKTN